MHAKVWLLAAAVLLLWAGPARAAVTTPFPCSTAGMIVWDDCGQYLQYCTSSSWWKLPTGQTGCSGVTAPAAAGKFTAYNGQLCISNGTTWSGRLSSYTAGTADCSGYTNGALYYSGGSMNFCSNGSIVVDGGVSVQGLTSTLVSYTQNFDSLGTGTISWANDSQVPNWYLLYNGTSTNPGVYASDGTSTTSYIVNFGTSGAADRALGTATNTFSFGTNTLGLRFVNTGAGTVTSLTVNYTGEEWRRATTSGSKLAFSYSKDATSLTTGTWTAVPALDFTPPQIGATGALDGNAAANRTAISSSISGLSVPPGSAVWLRWVQPDTSTPSPPGIGLAIDDVSISAMGPANSACAVQAKAWKAPTGGTTGGVNEVCSISYDNKMYCWGIDPGPYGTIGNGSNASSATPALVSGGYTDWTDVAPGGTNAACGIRNGLAYCWGWFYQNQVGNSNYVNQNTPALVAGGYTDWTKISMGYANACGIRGSGLIYCWGDNASGQVGNGTSGSVQATPALVSGGYTDWASVTVGSQQSCGVRTAGAGYCWGGGAKGNGSGYANNNTPVQVSGYTWSKIYAGTNYNSDGLTCGISTAGILYCWGTNGYGGLGSGVAYASLYTPTAVLGGYTDWVSASVGAYSVCGVRSNGTLWCWGRNNQGQLGNGTTADAYSPQIVSGGFTDWTAVSFGSDSGGSTNSTCGWRANGRMYCWGSGGTYKMGNGTTSGTYLTPQLVNSPP